MKEKELGLAWWNSLTPRQKEEEVGVKLDEGKTCTAIAEEFELTSRNSIITVRARLRVIREARGISMAKWNTASPSRPKKPAQSAARARKPRFASKSQPHAGGRLHEPLPLDEQAKTASYSTVPKGRDYGLGPSSHLSEKERGQRGVVGNEDNRSSMPKPSEDLPRELINYINKHVYTGV